MRLQPIELPSDYGGIRDPQILLAPDGFYYLTGTTGKNTLHVPGCRLWRSADLKTWEALGDEHGVVWYVDQAEWTKEPFKVGVVPHPVHDFWAPEIHFVNGNYYIPFCMFGGGFGLLRSASGRCLPGRSSVLLAHERGNLCRAGDVGYPMRAIRTEQYLYVRNYAPDRWPAGDPDRCGDVDPIPTKQLLIDGKDDPRIRPFYLRADGDCRVLGQGEVYERMEWYGRRTQPSGES